MRTETRRKINNVKGTVAFEFTQKLKNEENGGREEGLQVINAFCAMLENSPSDQDKVMMKVLNHLAWIAEGYIKTEYPFMGRERHIVPPDCRRDVILDYLHDQAQKLGSHSRLRHDIEVFHEAQQPELPISYSAKSANK